VRERERGRGRGQAKKWAGATDGKCACQIQKRERGSHPPLSFSLSHTLFLSLSLPFCGKKFFFCYPITNIKRLREKQSID